jgi:hypothetical protein
VKKVAESKPAPNKPDQKAKFVLFPTNVTGQQILDKPGIVPKK